MRNAVYGLVDVLFKAIIVLLVTLLSVWLLILGPLNTAERQRARSIVSAAIGVDGWKSNLTAEIPVCLVWEVDTAGKVVSSNIQVYEGENALSFVPPYDIGPEYEDKLIGALGNVVEPLRDRYPLVGRTTTFGYVACRLSNGNWIVVAYWQPFAERLYWLVYAIMIYFYLMYWVVAPIWVYIDSRANGLPLSPFIALSAVANVVGVVAYLVWKRRRNPSGWKVF